MNENTNGYDELTSEEDPFVLTALLWSWIDHLKEPILREQEIIILFKYLINRKTREREYEKYDYRMLNWKEIDKVSFFPKIILCDKFKV